MLILNLTDAFFVGRTEDTYQISAMAVTFPIVMMIGCIATIFAAGGNANIAASLGRKDIGSAKKFSAFSMYTAIGIVAFMIILFQFIKNPLLGILGADNKSLGFCKSYLLWVFSVGGLPLCFCQVMAQLFIAEGKTKVASVGIAGAGLLNAVFDPVFILGFNMGVAGAGAATCIANYINLIFFLAVYYRSREQLAITLNVREYTIKGGIAKRTLTIGVPAGLGMLLLNGCDFIRNSLIGRYGGATELASWGVVQKIGNAFMQICVGISQGVRPLVSYNFNAKALKRTKSIVYGAFLIMGVYTVFCVLLTAFIPALLVKLFLPVEDAIPIAVSFLQKWTLCIIGVGFIELFNSIFQAMGRWKISMANVVIGKVMLMLAMLFFVRLYGVVGVIISQPVVDTAVALVLLIVYLIVMRKENIREGIGKNQFV